MMTPFEMPVVPAVLLHNLLKDKKPRGEDPFACIDSMPIPQWAKAFIVLGILSAMGISSAVIIGICLFLYVL